MTPGPAPDLLRSRHRPAALVTLAGLALSIAFALLSDGSIQDDGLTHYLYARWGWNCAHDLLDTWGRPGMTVLYVPVARLGWTACRIQSALLSSGAAWLAYLTARRMGLRRAALVPLLVLAQPLFLALSYDTFTETAVAFYLALAAWLFSRGRLSLSALALSLCFVTRYEMLVVAVPWCWGLWRQSARWHAYAAMAWAPLTYSLAGKLWLGEWPSEVLRSNPHLSEYGAGTPLSMMVKSLVACGPAIGVLALVGCFPEKSRIRARSASEGNEESRDCDGQFGEIRDLGTLLALTYLTHLLAQSVLYWRGAFSSGGYARFFVSTAPVAGILALRALNRLRSSRPRTALFALIVVMLAAWIGVEWEPSPRDEVWLLVYHKVRPLVRALVVTVLLAAGLGIALGGVRASGIRRAANGVLLITALASMVGPWAFLVRPHRLTTEARDVAAAVAWLKAHGLDSAPPITTHVWTAYFLQSEHNLTALPGRDPLESAREGDVLIWDARYSPSERFGLSLERLQSDPRWRLLWTGPERDLARAGLARDTPIAPFVRMYRWASPSSAQ